MKKLLLVLVAIFFVASSAYAWVETAENGPENVTTCYMIGTGPCTSGSVVVLSNTATTQPAGRTIQWYGKEVTGTVTAGLSPYGVIIDQTNYSALEMIQGKFIKVLVSGYVPNIRVTTLTTDAAGAVTAGDAIVTSTLSLIGKGNNTGAVTGNCVALSAQLVGAQTATIRAFVGRQN